VVLGVRVLDPRYSRLVQAEQHRAGVGKEDGRVRGDALAHDARSACVVVNAISRSSNADTRPWSIAAAASPVPSRTSAARPATTSAAAAFRHTTSRPGPRSPARTARRRSAASASEATRKVASGADASPASAAVTVCRRIDPPATSATTLSPSSESSSRPPAPCTTHARSVPRRPSTSAPPTAPDTARLPCLATGTPAAAATRPAAVETLSVPAPSPPVPQVSIASAGTSGMETAWARSTRAAPASSATASPFMRSATSRLATSAALAAPERISSTHADISLSERSWPSTTRAIASRSGTALPSGGARRLAAAQAGEEVAEQPLALGGEDRLGVELHPLDEERAVPDAHDLVLGGPRRALELGWQRRRIDHQRVVAGRREALGEAREQPAPVVQDGRGLAVHDAP